MKLKALFLQLKRNNIQQDNIQQFHCLSHLFSSKHSRVINFGYGKKAFGHSVFIQFVLKNRNNFLSLLYGLQYCLKNHSKLWLNLHVANASNDSWHLYLTSKKENHREPYIEIFWLGLMITVVWVIVVIILNLCDKMWFHLIFFIEWPLSCIVHMQAQLSLIIRFQWINKNKKVWHFVFLCIYNKLHKCFIT